MRKLEGLESSLKVLKLFLWFHVYQFILLWHQFSCTELMYFFLSQNQSTLNSLLLLVVVLYIISIERIIVGCIERKSFTMI